MTGIQRPAEHILKEQSENNKTNLNKLVQLRNYTEDFYNFLKRDNNISIKNLGELMHKTWYIKKSLASSITSNLIDKLYDVAITNGAVGGKICGAGGGGFLMIIAEPKYHLKITHEFKKLKIERYYFEFESAGTQLSEIN